MKPGLFLLGLLLLLPTPARAVDLKLAVLFSDHMVLQREKPVPVWGWADPGERVTVEFAGKKKTATADAQGSWRVTLDAMAASAEGRALVLQSESGARRVEVRDILVGEVWLGSGQSNMAWTVARSRDFDGEKAAANLPLIRMFREDSNGSPTMQTNGKGKWTVCAPDTVGPFSATLYFFGRELHRELKVPIGLINSSVGGTPIESWIAGEAQGRTPELKASYEAESRAHAEFDEAKARANYETALARWNERVEKAKAAGETPPAKPADPIETRNRRAGPGGLFNGKIAPLIPFAIRGILWYQGEANASPVLGVRYQYQLPLLVEDWRARWGDELPFAWVQLPNFIREGEGWMLVREAMLKTLRLPKTGMAITVDIGDPKDIHPTNKQDVGKRLSMWALGSVYKKKGVAVSGPLPASHRAEGERIVVKFKHADGGLQAKGGELAGFVIAGEDRQWKPATARIEGDKVIVSSPDVKQPIAVRYAWAADPTCNLYNGQGIPASPFRTDDWVAPSK